MYQMYHSGSINYAGHLEESSPLQSNKCTNCQTIKRKTISHKTANTTCISSIRSDNDDQWTETSINDSNHRMPYRSNKRQSNVCHCTANRSKQQNCSTAIRSKSTSSINQNRSAFNMLILCLIYTSLLSISLVNGQFFGPPLRPPPNSNLAVPNSFESPNEINSIELFVHENARNHHTIDYEIVDGINPPLVIRRADVFMIGIKFRRPYDSRRDKVRLEFMFGRFFVF